MGENSEFQTSPKAADNDKDEELQLGSESHSASPLNQDLGATPAPPSSPLRVSWKYPPRRDFDVEDVSKVETVMWILDILIYLATAVLGVFAVFTIVPNYSMVYSCLSTAENILRLFHKCYRVQGGFDRFSDLIGDFQPGVIAIIFGLWGNDQDVLLIVNLFSVLFTAVIWSIELSQSYIKILIHGDVMKYLRAKHIRDRYEDIGLSRLLPCNEATNAIEESDTHGKYYTLEKIEAPGEDVKSRPLENVESPADLSDANDRRLWKIGKMLVSYEDNSMWVTINQKAEDRAVKTFVEIFTPEQKQNFFDMMEVWEERPAQGILKRVSKKRAHCFTVARLIDLTKQGFSVCWVETEFRKIQVGAEGSPGVEYFEDSIKEVLEMVYKRATVGRVSILIAIIAVAVTVYLCID